MIKLSPIRFENDGRIRAACKKGSYRNIDSKPIEPVNFRNLHLKEASYNASIFNVFHNFLLQSAKPLSSLYALSPQQINTLIDVTIHRLFCGDNHNFILLGEKMQESTRSNLYSANHSVHHVTNDYTNMSDPSFLFYYLAASLSA